MASHRIHKRRGLVDIPLRRGTVVRKRDSRSGSVAGNKRAIILGVAPGSNFTRAYGQEYFVCTIDPRYSIKESGAFVERKNGAQFMAVGRVKKMPKQCKEALLDYEQSYPSLGRKKRRK